MIECTVSQKRSEWNIKGLSGCEKPLNKLNYFYFTKKLIRTLRGKYSLFLTQNYGKLCHENSILNSSNDTCWSLELFDTVGQIKSCY